MRGYARRTNRRLSELAHTVVTDPTSIPELSARQPTVGDEPDTSTDRD
jgi:hypothetical protein